MNTDNSSKNAATIWVALTLFASAAEPLIVKFAYQGSVSPIHLTALKLVFGGLFIAPIYGKLHWIGLNGLKKIVVPSSLYITTYALIYWSLVYLPASTVITVISVTPALVALINQSRGHERSTIKFWLGIGACIVGILLTVEAFKADLLNQSILGVLFALASVSTSALYRTRMDVITKEYKPIVISGYLFATNSIVGFLLLPFLWPVPASIVPISIVTGFIAAIANIAFLYALHLVGSTRISVLTALQRPIVVLAAAIILSEPITYLQMIGIALVLFGVQTAKVQKIAQRPARA